MCTIKGFGRKLAVAILLAVPGSVSVADTNAPLPTFESVLQHVLQRAKAEGDNDHAFDERYRYARTKVTEFRNSAGQLKKREANTSVHVPVPVAPARQPPRRHRSPRPNRPRKNPRPSPTPIPTSADSKSRRVIFC